MSRIESFRPAAPSCSGGIAMQFAHQFPERTDRLVMIGSGGLGPAADPDAAGRHPARGEHRVAMLARFSEV